MVIEQYEKMLIEERYKNEIKLSDFMKKVDEQLQQFQADEEKESARLQSLMSAAKEEMEEIVGQQDRVKARLEYLTKIELVR